MSATHSRIDHEGVRSARQQSTDAVDKSTQRANAAMTDAAQSTSFWKGGANSAATAAMQRLHEAHQKLSRSADEFHAAVNSADATYTDTESTSTQQFTKLHV
jgi:hypothetical protein